MLKSDDLKIWLQRDLSRLDKSLLILATSDEPTTVSEIRDTAASAGFREPRKWNISQVLGTSKGKAIRTGSGWELTETGKLHLRNLGMATVSPAATNVAIDLRKHLKTITDLQTHAFVEEAIFCHEFELYRAAIVMSWLGAMDVLQKHIHRHHLAAFNAEAIRVMGGKWKDARTADDLGKMKESDFLDRIENLSVIGKNQKAQLKSALNLRNSCGHPNSLKIGANTSAAHLEMLLLNVFEAF